MSATAPIRAEDRLARVLSEIFAPGVTVLVLCVVTGYLAQPQGWAGIGWGSVTALFCSVLPMGMIHLAVHRQRLTDHHVTRREQRWWVFLGCALSVICAVALLVLAHGPALLLWLLLTMLVGLLVTGGITVLGLKVSMHAFCFTALVLVAGFLGSPWWLLLLPLLLPVLAYARLRLRHHSLLEVALGTGLAGVVMAVMYELAPTVG